MARWIGRHNIPEGESPESEEVKDGDLHELEDDGENEEEGPAEPIDNRFGLWFPALLLLILIVVLVVSFLIPHGGIHRRSYRNYPHPSLYRR